MSFGSESDGAETLHAALDNPQFTLQPTALGTVDPVAPSATKTSQIGAASTDYLALAARDDRRLFGLQYDGPFVELDPVSGVELSLEMLPQVGLVWPATLAFSGEDVFLFGDYGLTNDMVEVVR